VISARSALKPSATGSRADYDLAVLLVGSARRAEGKRGSKVTARLLIV